MKLRPKSRIIAGGGIVAMVATTLSLLVAGPASAHDFRTLADCLNGIMTDNSNYAISHDPSKVNTIEIKENGVDVVKTTFQDHYSADIPFKDPYVDNTYEVIVHAWDNQAYSYDTGVRQVSACQVPTIKDAAASAGSLTKATCDAPSVPSFWLDTATTKWATEGYDTSVGTHTREAVGLVTGTGDQRRQHVFADGQVTAYEPYTISPPLGYQSDNPEGACYKAPTPVTPNVQYGVTQQCTANGEVVTITATNVEKIEKGEVAQTGVLLIAEGHSTITVDVPANQTVTKTLNFPLGGENLFTIGVKDGVMHTVNVEPCGVTTVPSNGEYQLNNQVCGTLTVTFTNPETLKENEKGLPAEFTYQDGTKGAVQTVEVAANQSKTVTFTYPNNTGDHIVFVGLQGKAQQQVHVNADCTKTVVIPVAPTPPTTCTQWSVPGKEVVSDQKDFQKEFTVDNGRYYVQDQTSMGTRQVLVVFVPNEGFVVGPPTAKNDYQLVTNTAIWKYTFENGSCQTTPPTPPATTPPVPPTKPTPPVTPPTTQPTSHPTTQAPVPTPVKTPSQAPSSKATSVAAPLPSNNGPTSGTLAFTGSLISPWWAGGALLVVIMAGMGMIFIGRRNKRFNQE